MNYIYIIIILIFATYSCSLDRKSELKQELQLSNSIDSSTYIEYSYNDSLAYAFLNNIISKWNNYELNSNILNESIIGVSIGIQPEENADSTSKMLLLNKFLLSPLLNVKNEDSQWINLQIDYWQGKSWDFNRLKLKSNKTIKKDSLETIEEYQWRSLYEWRFSNSNDQKCFVSLGYPIFNKQFDIVIIYIGVSCQGTLGHGALYRYEFKNHSWIKTSEKWLWIS